MKQYHLHNRPNRELTLLRLIPLILMVFGLNVGIFAQGNAVNHSDIVLNTGWYRVSKDSTDIKYVIERTSQVYYIDKNILVSAERFEIAKFTTIKQLGQKVLEIHFDSLGLKQWENATSQNMGNQLAFIVENKLINVPLVNNKISSGRTNVVLADLSKNEIKMIRKSIKKQVKLNQK